MSNNVNLADKSNECDDVWSDRAYQTSFIENYFEVLIVSIIAVYGMYVLHKLIIKLKFCDFIAITVPMIIVIYSMITVCMYWHSDMLNFDKEF